MTVPTSCWRTEKYAADFDGRAPSAQQADPVLAWTRVNVSVLGLEEGEAHVTATPAAS